MKPCVLRRGGIDLAQIGRPKPNPTVIRSINVDRSPVVASDPRMWTGKAFTAKGMQVLELVGKKTMDLVITLKLKRMLKMLNKKVQQMFSLSTKVNVSGVESDKGKNVETGTEGSGDELKNLHYLSVSKVADMVAGFTNALAGQTVNDIIQRTVGIIESLHSEGVHSASADSLEGLPHASAHEKADVSILGPSFTHEPDDTQLRTIRNQWPAHPPEFRDVCEEYAGEVEKLAYKMLELISLSLGFPGKSIIVITNKVQDEDEDKDADGDMLNIDWP
ncbi:hypothetical protein LWI29_032897 [Acer saccharum]|uniref:DUF7798 domain-containing protein n=1 Tax=Acer saccharum TaxID=4024 RepID=A0AA39W5W5_ACESA|nr:hypothetical protein LWI29_032897 [Acer saccharum]